MWNILFAGRYVVLLMGCFSMYTGLMYNDLFSKSINIFGSHWTINRTEHNLNLVKNAKDVTLDPRGEYYNYPYPVGLDPIWQVAENKIIFLNNLKMKTSIILGVSHMLFGVCLSLWNHR